MANLHHQHPNEGWSQDNNWWSDCNVYLNSQDTNGNYSNVTIEIVQYSTSSGISQSGSWNGQIWVNGSLVANTNSSRTINNAGQQIAVWTGNIGHDANGNASPYVEYYANMPATSMSRRGGNWGLPRIPLAPTISDVSLTPGSATVTTAQLRAETSSLGHGTSSTWTMYYREQGSGSWISLGSQGDSAGYNYWDLTSLKPGTTFEFYANATNNNGDSTNSGTSTFTTLPAPNTSVPLLKIVGVL